MRLAGSKPSTSCAKRGITQMSRSSRIRRAKRSSQMGAAAVNLARLVAASSSSLSVKSMRNCGGACKHRNIMSRDAVPSCANPLSQSYETRGGATAMWMLRGRKYANPEIPQIRSVAKTAPPTMCQWTFSVNHKSETQTQDSVLAVALTIHTGQHTANRQCIIPT